MHWGSVWFTVALLAAPAQSISANAAANSKTQAPKIWDEKALKDWASIVAGINLRPNHYTEAEYYAAPVDNLRTYPVYHPDHEPAGYLESLRKRGPQPLLELGKARTREEWIETGRRVWDELDVKQVRTTDFRIIDYTRSREALKKYPQRLTQYGQLLDLRWVVDRGGELKLSVRDCATCHSRVTAGRVISGSQANFPPPPAAPMFNFIFAAFAIPKEAGEDLPMPGEGPMRLLQCRNSRTTYISGYRPCRLPKYRPSLTPRRRGHSLALTAAPTSPPKCRA